MNETLEKIERFHGHIGPYAVIGYRMGEIANRMLGTDPFFKKAVVWTGANPPLSCIVDGIQISSGCTFGKGNIAVKNKSLARAEFSNNDGKHIKITLKPSIQEEIDTKVTDKNIVIYSEKICRLSDEELFEMS